MRMLSFKSSRGILALFDLARYKKVEPTTSGFLKPVCFSANRNVIGHREDGYPFYQLTPLTCEVFGKITLRI